MIFIVSTFSVMKKRRKGWAEEEGGGGRTGELKHGVIWTLSQFQMENRHLPLGDNFILPISSTWSDPQGSNSRGGYPLPFILLVSRSSCPHPPPLFPPFWLLGLGWAGRTGQRLSQAADALRISCSAIRLPESEQFLEVSSAVEPRVGPALPHS